MFFVVVPLVLYFSIFVIHFSLLTKSGEGDAFMTPTFQSSLQGSSYAEDLTIKPLNTFQKFIELNKEMYTANATLTATHPYSSKWYTWPFMIRPIYYWNHLEAQPPSDSNSSSQATPTESKIYFIGNPVIWWASTVAILYLLISSIPFSKRLPTYTLTGLVIMGGFLINLLPFVGIGRVMFLYHYLASLIFAILALAYLVDQQKNSRRIWIALLVVGCLSFLYFAPLSYGLPLSAPAFQNHLWLTTWQ